MPATSTKKGPNVWEVSSFLATEDYVANPDLFAPVTRVIAEHTPHDIYTGLQIEEPANRVTEFVGWDSIEQHISTSPFTQLIPHVALCTNEEPEVRHVFFHGDGEELLALRAPVTEFCWMSPKPGVDDAEFQESMRLGNDLFDKDERCIGAAWGMVIEPEALKNTAVYVAGWKSKEEREEVVRELFDKMHACAEGVRGQNGKQAKTYDEISDITVVHLKLRSGRD